MRPRTLLAAIAVAGLLLGRESVSAEEWGGIDPGVTTVDQVRARYGAPSKETRAKADGYDTLRWVYEDARAPGGIERMTIDYGLLTPQGYKPTVVRVLRLEPKPKVFGRNTVIQGWGVPDGITKHNEMDVFFYKSGLLVNFDKGGEEAALLTLTPPQPDTSSPAAPKP
ncbi:MAG TPA: hypothetical protein VFO08_15015 [Methylomirabilota bacterium]|nr:hypothetical protein [Methylomirabilota bacterium]